MNRRGMSLFLSILLLFSHIPQTKAFDPFSIGATFGPQITQGAIVVLGVIGEKTVEFATAIAGYWGLSAIYKRWLGKKITTTLITATEAKLATTVAATVATNSSSTTSQPTSVNNPSVNSTTNNNWHPPLASSHSDAPVAPKTFQNPIKGAVNNLTSEYNRRINGSHKAAQDALFKDFKSALQSGDTRTAVQLHDLAKAKGFNSSQVNAMASDLSNIRLTNTGSASIPPTTTPTPSAPITPQGPVTPPTITVPATAPQPAAVPTPAPSIPATPSSSQIDWGDPGQGTGGKSFARDVVETAMGYKMLKELKAQNNEPQRQHPLANPNTNPANPEPGDPEKDKNKNDNLSKLASTPATEELKQRITQETKEAIYPLYKIVKDSGEKCRIVRPENDLKAIEWAPKKYDEIRKWTHDVEKIADNTGIPKARIERIKQHLFHKEHILRDGKVGRFDPDHEIASAWDRLTHGDFIKNDIKLLEHEAFESKFESLFKTDYATAHDAAQHKLKGKFWDYPQYQG